MENESWGETSSNLYIIALKLLTCVQSDPKYSYGLRF